MFRYVSIRISVDPYIVNRMFIVSSIVSVMRHIIIAIVTITTMCTSVIESIIGREFFVKIGWSENCGWWEPILKIRVVLVYRTLEVSVMVGHRRFYWEWVVEGNPLDWNTWVGCGQNSLSVC